MYMKKEIACNTLAEAFEYIEKNLDDGTIYTVELVPSEKEKAGDDV